MRSAIFSRRSILCPKGDGGAGSNASNKYSFRDDKSLDGHYDKHGKEFGNITKEQYLQKANNLVDSKSSDILTKVRANGDNVYYNKATNEFAMKTIDDVIRTYFKPVEGINYFYMQQ